MSMYLTNPSSVLQRTRERGGMPRGEVIEDITAGRGWQDYQAWLDMLCLSDLVCFNGDHDHAMALVRAGSKGRAEPCQIRFSLVVLATRHRKMGKINNAAALLTAAIRSGTLSNLFLTDAYRRLAYVLTDRSELTNARQAAELALRMISERRVEPEGNTVAGCYTACGHVAMMSAQFVDAREFYGEAWRCMDVGVEAITGYIVAHSLANITSLDEQSTETDMEVALDRLKELESYEAFAEGTEPFVYLKWCRGRLLIRLETPEEGLSALRNVKTFFESKKNMHSWVSVSTDLILALAKARRFQEACAVVRELIPVIRSTHDVRFSEPVRQAFQQLKIAVMGRANVTGAARVLQAALARQGNVA